jgi:hypothetical protein
MVGRCGIVVRNTPAAEAPTTVAVAAAPQASGRILSTWTAWRNSVLPPSSSAIPAGGSPARHPLRREARIASMIAARWHAASSPADT